MEEIHIGQAQRIRGEITLPGDKSIAHRAALIGAVSEGQTLAVNFPAGEDCRSTLKCLRQLGVEIEHEGDRVSVTGRGLGGLLPAAEPLDAGNSGTTARLLSGILAGHAFRSTIVGDASLSRRPMARIVEPLSRFGARLEASEGRLPLHIDGGGLEAIHYRLPVASAQVKSAVLLAGTHARGTTLVEEPVATRDHTEIALGAAGASIRRGANSVEIDGGVPLRGRPVHIPGDISSAAFFIAAALIVPDSEIVLRRIGRNPTRSGFTDLLSRLGCSLVWQNLGDEGGEPLGDLHVRSSEVGRLEVEPEQVPALVDELPMVAVLAALSGRGGEIRGAGELRYKETDRIRALAVNLRAIGAEVVELDDGLEIRPSTIRGGQVSSFGDHRIAMAFAVAGLVARTGMTITEPACVDISFPTFFDLLEECAER